MSMDEVIDYVFGVGDGPTTRWSSPVDTDVDGDGSLDAVALDFDGDGRIDDAMWDADGNGIADTAALDLDDDGVLDAFFRDGGRGLWELPTDPPAKPRPPPTPPPAHPSGSAAYDLTGDSVPDARAVDLRMHDGQLIAGRVYLDTNGDGTFDYVIIDRTGDGVADAAEEVK